MGSSRLTDWLRAFSYFSMFFRQLIVNYRVGVDSIDVREDGSFDWIRPFTLSFGFLLDVSWLYIFIVSFFRLRLLRVCRLCWPFEELSLGRSASAVLVKNR